jgi:Zn finger protein HypA/HybF involved in hydrogenase expression
VAVAEDNLFSGFISVADKTQTEWVEFNDELAHGGTYGSGEYAVAGKLKCEHCGQVIQLRHFSRIPPCPKCHKVQFQRAH